MKKLLRLLRLKMVIRKRKRSREDALWSHLMTNERKIREEIEQIGQAKTNMFPLNLSTRSHFQNPEK